MILRLSVSWSVCLQGYRRSFITINTGKFQGIHVVREATQKGSREFAICTVYALWGKNHKFRKCQTDSPAPFALHFCPQSCWSRQISWITCELQTETVTNRFYVNRQINVSLLSANIKLMYTSFDLLTDRLTPSVIDWLLIMYGILLQQLFVVAAVVYSGSSDFFIWPM